MIIDFKKQKGFNFEIDLEKSTSFSDLKLYIENSIDECLEFFELEKNGWNSLKHRMYFLNCLCSFEPEKGMIFSYYESDLNSSKVPCLYQIEKDNPIDNGTLLKFDATIIPLSYMSLAKNQFTDEICIDICEKYFARINRKCFDFISKEETEQNDILAVVEESSNGLVVTTFENMPSAENAVAQKDDYQQLLDDIESVIDIVSNDNLPYHERAKANRVLSVYFDRLNKYVHDTHVESIKAENKADKEYYRLYYGFLDDPKNVAENGKKPSDASAKAYATNLTLDLYQDAKLSEALLKYLQSRLRSLNSIFEGVRQEVSNDKKIEEQTKSLK